MGTVLVDLDGGGLPDDAVIAYPVQEGWRLRATLDSGIVSETEIADEHDFIIQFAAVVGPLHLFTDTSDHVMVQIREGELNDHRLFALDGTCIRAYTTSDAEFIALPVNDGDDMKLGFACEVRDGIPWIHGNVAMRDADNWQLVNSTYVSSAPFVLDWGGPGAEPEIVVGGDPILDAIAEADCDRLSI